VTIEAYYLPESLDEALGLMAENNGALLVMAGGTITMPLINEGISDPEKVMGLRNAGLNYIEHQDGQVLIGAATTLTQMVDLESIPLLQEAARNTGAWAVRNLATVGGNLFVPPPAGDFAVALLALGAELKLVNQRSERLLPLADFYKGFLTNDLQLDELLVEIQVPVPAGDTAYIKYGRKQANTPAIITVAAHIVQNNGVVEEARIALNGVGPHPILATSSESILIGSPLEEATILEAAAAAANDCEPFTDAISSEWYRRKMVPVYVSRALEQIAGEGG
jgi:CO/xanthine dehydrogenase FAD-binding subunit